MYEGVKAEADHKIDDAGIDSGIQALTDKKIESVITKFLKSETGARFKVYTDICVHCGLCADACHFFLSNDRNPKFSPSGKVKQTIGEIVAKKGKVNSEFIWKLAEIAFTECNVCKRCVMYCPFGIDVAYLMLTMRRLCHQLGVVPQNIQDTAHSHSATFNQMWIKEDEWIDSLQWQEEEAREELPKLRIPLEKQGADIFYSVIGPEPKFRAQLLYQAAVIMNTAGVDWTMPATPGWDNSDMCMYTGDYEMMGRLKRSHFETAMRLKAKRIVMGECGHAFRSVYDVGNRFLGWKMPPIPITHAVAFYHELLIAKKIKIAHLFEEPVTFHDPCNIVRGGGLHEIAREVIRYTCKTFIEMIPNREHNYCCSAGGGLINCGAPYKMKRVEGNRVKAEQLKEAKKKGANIVIAPCHNCHGGLEDIIHHYGLDMKLKFLGDIIYETMEKPEDE
ncbi:MAG: (Fe-S)-binding protein [Desulfobacterales bacterium]|nr:(Fe-S)-binding protein [Desulfobacterales bacterium]